MICSSPPVPSKLLIMLMIVLHTNLVGPPKSVISKLETYSITLIKWYDSNYLYQTREDLTVSARNKCVPDIPGIYLKN